MLAQPIIPARVSPPLSAGGALPGGENSGQAPDRQRPVTVCLHRGTSLVSRLIRWHSRGEYSHASILMPDGRHYEAREGKGVLRHPHFTLTNKSEQVDQFTLKEPLTEQELNKLEYFLLKQVGKRYDWPMVFGFVSRSEVEGTASAGKWFCSELVYAAFHAIGRPLLATHESWRIDPATLGLSPFLVRLP